METLVQATMVYGQLIKLLIHFPCKGMETGTIADTLSWQGLLLIHFPCKGMETNLLFRLLKFLC